MRPAPSLQWWDGAALFLALGGLVILAWVLLIGMSGRLPVMDSDVGIRPWSASDFGIMIGMWVVMMVAMMVPTAVRSVLIFSRISAKTVAGGRPYVAGYWFVFGYLVAWSGFAVTATFFQWFLDQMAMLSPKMVASSPVFGALILMSAGAWQLTPWKNSCLKQCQSPLMFLATNFSPGIGGAVQLGVRHGLYCLGCCWMIMGLLFVGGIMNLFWILAITAFILVEKLLPSGEKWGRIGGVAMILSGILYLILA